MIDWKAKRRPERRRAAKARIRLLLRFRFELALFTLLIASLAIVISEDALFSRTLDITPATVGQYAPRPYGDEIQGGTSRAVRVRPFGWACRLTGVYQYRYCTYELNFDRARKNGIDLSRMDGARMLIDYDGPADTLRVYLKNADPRYSRPDRVDSDKFNAAEVMVRRGRNVIDLRLADFRVAEWWIAEKRIPLEASEPQFDNIVALQIQTGTRAPVGDYRFSVRLLTIERHLITPAELYAGLLALWALLVGGFLVSRIISLNRDLERRSQSQAAALRLARHAEESARRDHLTRLFNRSGIIDLYHSLARGRQPTAGFALMLLDVDHFKQINDRFGHAVGDTVLSAMAELLESNTRSGDIVGRWGGEEFLLICRTPDTQSAIDIAEKLRIAIETHDFACCDQVTASLGVYCCLGVAEELEVVVARADAALYQAKAEGRNRTVLYGAEQSSLAL
jgi:diguanylate cyclase (GGDEF)-like protein